MNTVIYRCSAVINRHMLFLMTMLLLLVFRSLAAPAADSNARKEELEEVVVTGTLIRGIAPVGSNVITTTREDIEASGATDTNQLLNQLPQSNTFMTLPQPGLGVAQGVARVPLNQPNLRNLPGGATGNPVTLVLMDGHRIVPSGIEQSLVDVGTVPPGVIERVETILDGASALYGSDAVGGVINYMTRKRFNDTKADVQYGFADNYHAVDGNLTTGKTWDGGGIGFTYSYANNSNLLNKDRDYALTRNYLLPGAPLTGTACEDHSTVTVAGQTFSSTAAPATFTPGTINCAANAYGSFVAAQDRHAAFVDFSQDLGDSVKFDMTALFSYRKTDQSFPPTISTATIRQGVSPYFQLMPGIAAASQATQSVAFSYGPLFGSDFNHFVTTTSLWQVTPSVTVDLGRWQLRALVAYGKSKVTFESPVLDTVAQGIAVGAAGPALTTATTINPYNIAATTNLALVKSLFYTTHRHGQHTYSQASLVADGPLFSMPGGEVKGAFGAEWSKTEFTRVDTNAASHLLQPSVSAATSPKSLFGEVNVPLVGESNKRPGIQELTLSASLRWDDYQVFGKTTNPKIAISYQPVDWLTLRANWGKSFRAPTVVDKVASLANSLSCVGNVPGCLAGFFFAPPGVVLPTNPIFLFLTGARPDLEPETSKNWSIGFDLRPIDGLTISPSYWHIDYSNQISLPTQGANGGLAQIFAGAPQLITMNPTAAQMDAVAATAPNGGTQTVAFVRSNPYNVVYILDGRTTNLGAAKVSGVDFNVRYTRRTSFGSIDAMLNGIRKLEDSSGFFPSSPLVDNLGANQPLLTLTAMVAATIKDFRAQATLQRRSGYDISPSATRLASQTNIDSFTLVNLSFRYNVNGKNPLAQDLGLTLTINNVLNKEPPISLTTTGGSINGQTLGRFAQLGISKKF